MDVELSLERRARVHAALGEPSRLAIVDALALADASPSELGAALGLGTNLVAHHLRVLEEAGVIARSRSEGDRRRTYLRLTPGVVAAFTPPPREAPRVVFVCTHNSARSQLAAALWGRRNRVPAASAGTRPADRVHPRAVRVAARHGLALDRARPRYAGDVIDPGDLVVAVCDKAYEQLSRLPARSGWRLHWSVPDPAGHDTDEAFEAAYTDIAGRIDRLATALTTPTAGDDHD